MLAWRYVWWALLCSFLPAAASADFLIGVLWRFVPTRIQAMRRVKWFVSACFATMIYVGVLRMALLCIDVGLHPSKMRACVANGRPCTVLVTIGMDVDDSLVMATHAYLCSAVLHVRVSMLWVMIALRAVVLHPWTGISVLCFAASISAARVAL